MKKWHTGRHGFTLVEMSTVLVIIGLIVGGVLVGQDLVRASELRSVVTQYQGFVAATHAFHNKYSALPGDMNDATTYWGAADGGTGNNVSCYSSTTPTSPATCNGDGSNIVNIPSIPPIGSCVTNGSCEGLLFWQHLANAGLITGTYGYDSGLGTSEAPLGKISGSQWWMAANWDNVSRVSAMFSATAYGNTLVFMGAPSGTAGALGSPVTYKTGSGPGAKTTLANIILRPVDAYNIDAKIDDGNAITGNVIALENSSTLPSATGCTDASSFSDTSANYLRTNNLPACALAFLQSF